eukprot:13832779-Alexandrium_andersonii.AAC.1
MLKHTKSAPVSAESRQQDAYHDIYTATLIAMLCACQGKYHMKRRSNSHRICSRDHAIIISTKSTLLDVRRRLGAPLQSTQSVSVRP